MRADSQHILRVIDVQKWENLQESLAKVTGLAIITVDYKGVPITKHSGCQKFCQLVRANSELAEHCQKCDSRGGLEATRLKTPYIYKCHFNILDAAVPILVDDNYVGAVMVGQTLLNLDKDSELLEQICMPSNRIKLARQTKQYDEYYNALPQMSLNRVKMIVEMLFHLCNYVVEEAAEKNLAQELCVASTGLAGASTYSIKGLKGLQKQIGNTLIDAHMRQNVHSLADEEAAGKDAKENPVLKPAFEYIDTHKNEACSLKELSALCHVSPSYFSRLFKRETGENYSSYMVRIRVDWAKQLLCTTNYPINQIAFDVGFSDAGHFIKTFKRCEGVTPARFRKFTK